MLSGKIYNTGCYMGRDVKNMYDRHLHIMITDEMHEFIKNNMRGEMGFRVRQMILIYMGKASRADKELFIAELLRA